MLLGSGDLALAAPELRFGAVGRRQRWSCERSGDVGFRAELRRCGARGWRKHWSCGARAVRRRWDGRIRAPCVIRGASAAKRAPPWQDLRAVHSRKAICGAFRIHGARILPKPAHFGCMAAICCQGGALFSSEAPSGMHKAKTCHGLPSRNASGRNLAIARRPGTHRGRILPRLITCPKTKEGERTARLLSLFSFTARVAQDLRSDKPPTFGIPLGWGFRVRRNCASRPIC